jgi:hypothetical protein
LLLALSGCDHDVPEARTPRHERRAAIEECVATIEVYPAGGLLPQPYRVVAPLDASFVGNWGWSSASRFKRMKKRACELGADAIIDADDPGADSRVITSYQYDAYGRPISVVQEASRNAKRSTALAIQFAGPEVAAPEVLVAPQGMAAPPMLTPPIVVTQVVVPQAVSRYSGFLPRTLGS